MIKFSVFLFSFYATSFSDASCIKVLAEPGLKKATANVYEWEDPQHSGYYLKADLLENGVLEFSIRTKQSLSSDRSDYRGFELFNRMINHFGIDNIWAISGRWTEGVNLDEYNLNRQNMSSRTSARNTWTGRRARALGFTRVLVLLEKPSSQPDTFTAVEVLFERRLTNLQRYRYLYENGPF